MGRAVEFMLKSFAENSREPIAVPSAEAAEPSPARAVSTVAPDPPLEKGRTWLDDVVTRASRRYGVEVGLIKAVIKAESNFNPKAVSPVGAQGLMQLMPATARGLGVTDSFDPEQNVMAGTKFLKDLLARYNGNVDKALAAYNWGPGNVDRKPHLLPRETREYLVKVKEYYNQFA
jgi:soluble lytic murein transglycosylase-like protein